MKSVLRCAIVIGALILAACGGYNAEASRVSAMPPMFPVVPTAQHVSTTSQRSGKQNLYVTSASPYFFNGYHLPLQRGEGPTLTERGVNEPVPIVDDGHDLYVGSFDDGTIFAYPLPVVSNLGLQKPACPRSWQLQGSVLHRSV